MMKLKENTYTALNPVILLGQIWYIKLSRVKDLEGPQWSERQGQCIFSSMELRGVFFVGEKSVWGGLWLDGGQSNSGRHWHKAPSLLGSFCWGPSPSRRPSW